MIVVIVAVLVLAACAVGVGHAGQPTTTAADTAADPGTPGAPPAPGAQPTALATRSTPLGTVATSDGLTVYQFAKDTSNPPASMCTGVCAKAWPPVMASDQLALHGVSVAEVGTVTRPDGGGVQLTLGGWPVYRYAKDKAPGDTSGQGVGGTWSALAPTGKPIKTAPAPAAGAAAAPAASNTGATGSCTTIAPTAAPSANTSTGGDSTTAGDSSAAGESSASSAATAPGADPVSPGAPTASTAGTSASSY